ncbi:restriction endonuclease subunit S [Vagococcus fluvialis]|uniref:restriction endonuclease subunit S n=1 Tax=Vagococcus fluvialis TaxID=2738 RepID=UPI003B5BAAEC
MLAWEQRKLGSVGKTQSGVGFPDSEQGGNEGIPFFKVSDMNNKGNENEMVTANNYVSEEQVKRKKWKPLETVPAVIFAKVGAAIMLNRKRIIRSPFLFDNNTMAYIFDDSWNVEFGKTLFETINLPKYAQIGALPSYNSSDIESIEVTVPDKIEQIKIGYLFKQLDKTIALHERELELLNLTKKGFLQQLFTNNSQLFPNIRFSDFQEEWKQHRLENVAKFSKGKGYTKNDLVQYGFKIILYGRMYTKYETIIESIDTYVENNDDCIFSFKDDVIMPSSGESSLDIVRASVVPYAGIILGGDINIIELDKKIMNPIFIALSISNGTLKKEISNLAQGNSVVHLYNSELKKVNVQSPVIQEQEIISNFFKQLDKIITLREKELENLKNVKSAFLQKIFV